MITVNGTIPKRIFPVRMNSKGEAIGPPFDPADGTPMWKPFQTRDPLPEEVAAWNKIAFPHNWALVLGAASGLTVLDIDPKNGADPAAIALKYAIPRTFTVRTPSGGLHWYFAFAPGLRSEKPFDRNAGVELKSNANLVLIPPSRMNGHRYEIMDDCEASPLPAKILERANAVHPGTGKWKQTLSIVPVGEQDDHLISLAGALARHLPAELWPTIASTLAAQAAPWPHDSRRGRWTAADFQRIADSACQMEQRRRTSNPLPEVPM